MVGRGALLLLGLLGACQPAPVPAAAAETAAVAPETPLLRPPTTCRPPPAPGSGTSSRCWRPATRCPLRSRATGYCPGPHLLRPGPGPGRPRPGHTAAGRGPICAGPLLRCLASGRQVITHPRTDDFDLPTDGHFPLSLILNEWVTNSIKYADTGAQALEIYVSVTRRADVTCIAYADNGRLPTPTRPGPSQPAHELGGLGTQIITLLARQLQGTLFTPPDQPYHYELSLPYVALAPAAIA